MKEEMPYSALSGVCSPIRASCNHPGCFSAFERSNSPVPNNRFGSTWPNVASTSSAVGLKRFKMAFNLSRSCWLGMRSILFITMTLANSNWSQKSCATVLSSSSAASQPRPLNVSAAYNSSMKEAPSTTVTNVSNLATSLNETPFASWKVKVSATGIGSDIPLLSTRM